MFRLAGTLVFNREINTAEDYISLGGFGMILNGKKVQFDFEEYMANVDKADKRKLDFSCKNPDYDCYEDLHIISLSDLGSVTEITEFGLCIEEPEDKPLDIMKIESLCFVLPYEEFRNIPIRDEVLAKISKNVFTFN